MVSNIMSLTGNGLKDWWFQRITALWIMGYAIFLFGFLVCHAGLEYTQWHELFACNVFQIATVVTLLSLLVHSWIGLWTVTTDYIKCTMIRSCVQWFIVLVLVVQFIYGMQIIWGR